MVNAVKVFKKTSPNGKITAYLSRRDFVGHVDHTSPVDGVVVVDHDYLRGRRVFATVTATFRHGHEEDEVMGLSFSKEYELTNIEVAPNDRTEERTDVQEQLIKKLGANAYAFLVSLPKTAPNSVILENGDKYLTRPLGVIYNLRLYVADHKEEKPHKRNSVGFAVRKVQYASSEPNARQPQTLVSKSFTLSPGKLNLEVSLDHDLYFHGQPMEAHLNIHNASKKTVKNMKAQVVQHVEVTMTNSLFSRVVSSLESREGCPITPGANLTKTITLVPNTLFSQKRFGIALDGQVKDKDVNLASSTVASASKNINDALGIIVAYTFRVKLNCGAIGGELIADLPFNLMHPDPMDKHIPTLKRSMSCSDLVIEDFAKVRRGTSVQDEE